MKTIKGIGKINIESTVEDGVGIRIVKNFLEELTIRFAKRSASYIDVTGEAPFSFGEKQVHSVLCPAISDLTPAVLMESPIERKWSKRLKVRRNDYTGFLDYWCRYRNTDLFIELKLNRENYKTSDIREDLYSCWEYMNNDQLKPIKKEAKDFAKWSKGVVRIGLHVIPIIDRAIKSDAIENWEELISIQKKFMDEISPEPNWSSVWMLDKKLALESWDEYSGDKKTYYPGVMLLCRVYPIITANKSKIKA